MRLANCSLFGTLALGCGILLGCQAADMRQTATAPAPAAGLPGPVATGPKKQVPSQVIDVAKLAVRTSNVGSRRDMFDGPTVTLNNLEGHISTLNPGQVSHAPHQHANEEIIILTEGKLEVYINGKITQANKGDVLFFSSLDWHNVKNIGDVPAMYYVINWSVPPKAVPTPSTAPASAPARIEP